jgi:putative NADPH-quinone reductase
VISALKPDGLINESHPISFPHMKRYPHHRIALVVVSHPDAASFNHAIARDSAGALDALGFTTHLCDLYADNFDPVITKEEVRGQRTEDHLTITYIRLLASVEVLVVVHPNCWGAPPAMMKGWMDRVFAQGSAYAFENLQTLSDGFTRPYLNSDTFTGACMRGGSAATRGNELLIPTYPLRVTTP